MNTVEWSDALLLDFEPMDKVHHEFVDLLAMAQSAPDNALPQAWSAVLDHTVHHFGREDEWMRKTRFASADNHMLQHRVVLNVLREGLANAKRTKEQSEVFGEFLAIDSAMNKLQPGELCLVLVDQVEEAMAHIAAKVASDT